MCWINRTVDFGWICRNTRTKTGVQRAQLLWRLADLDSANWKMWIRSSKPYSPNNAALSIVGDFEIEQAKQWIEKYFGPLKASTLPAKADISEKRQKQKSAFTKEDKLANKPGIGCCLQNALNAIRPSTRQWVWSINCSCKVKTANCFSPLVQDKGYTGGVSGGINYLGNMFQLQYP